MNARSRVGSAGLALALFCGLACFDAFVIRLPWVEYFENITLTRSPLAFSVRVAGVAAIACLQVLYFWASLRATGPWRATYLTLFALAAFVEYGYVKASGNLTTATDLVVAFHNPQLWPAVAPRAADLRALIPTAVYGSVLVFAPRPDAAKHLRRFLVVILVTVLLHSTYAIAGLRRPADEQGVSRLAPSMVAAQGFWRSLTLFGWMRFESRVNRTSRRQIEFHAAQQPTSHVVLVIDESIRGDHLSLNGYDRSTTPYLDQLKAEGKLVSWGVASAASNQSIYSVSGLLTGVSTVPDTERRTLSNPTIFQYAKAMNYETHLFDGEDVWERYPLMPNDFWMIDEWRRPRDFGGDVDADVRIASAVVQLMRQAKGQFIVVCKSGNHYPYDRHYPPSAALWSRENASIASEIDRSRNTYDDAIRYNVDAFFRRLTADADAMARTVILYTSDHGDAFFSEGRGWRAFVRETFSVPMIMLGALPAGLDPQYAAGHRNVFATVLDLLHVPSEYRVGPYGRSLIGADRNRHDPRYVFAGDLFGRDQFVVQEFDALPRQEPARARLP